MHELILKAKTGFEEDGNMKSTSAVFPYDDFDESSLGKPITKKFAQELIQNDIIKKSNDSSEIISVTFDTRPLLLLLSQKGCAGIRSYFARKEDGDQTLVLVGVDSKGNDLGATIPNNGKKGSIIMDTIKEKETSLLVEVGGGGIIDDFG